MNAFVRGSVLGLVLTFSLGSALADTPIAVTCFSPTWQIIDALGNGSGCSTAANPLPAIFELAPNEDVAEPISEQAGDFVFTNRTLASSGYYTIVDSDGKTISDYILFGNGLTAEASGMGEIIFYSDPMFPSNLSGLANAGVLCTENEPAKDLGCLGTFDLLTTAGDTVTVHAASDGENLFNPFNLIGNIADTSDDIAFTSTSSPGAPAPVSPAPEPSALLVTGALLGLLVRRQRRPSA
jgi:hypothetical protein